MMKNNLIALLDQTYPGVNALFDSPVREDGTQKWVDFAASFWHVDCAHGMSQSAFVQQYAKWCKQHRYQASSGWGESIHEGSEDLIAMLPNFASVPLRYYLPFLFSARHLLEGPPSPDGGIIEQDEVEQV